MTNELSQSADFSGLGIAPKLLDALEQFRFTTPTPIQLKSIPITIEGKDLVGIAQTGTGKTLAFGLPLIQRLAASGGKALILLPTRELALQVSDNLRNFARIFGHRTVVLIGGEPKNIQVRNLRQHRPNIIIATPGRLIDHVQSRDINLGDVKILVLDEADLMFDMGFIPQVTEILKSVPAKRQTLLFSATMPPAIMKIIAQHMSVPVQIEVAPSGTPAENIAQEMIVINKEDKFNQTLKILEKYKGSVLIFARTKWGVKGLARKLNDKGFTSGEIHSNRTLNQRSAALKAFKLGQVRILVATDIAARGIDVKGIELVLNYDLPDGSEDYVHRIGRTGRAGKSGQAISFASPHEMLAVKKIEQIIKKSIPLTKLAEPNYASSGPAPRRSHGHQPRRPGQKTYHSHMGSHPRHRHQQPKRHY